jgi:hypothetical protein
LSASIETVHPEIQVVLVTFSYRIGIYRCVSVICTILFVDSKYACFDDSLQRAQQPVGEGEDDRQQSDAVPSVQFVPLFNVSAERTMQENLEDHATSDSLHQQTWEPLLPLHTLSPLTDVSTAVEEARLVILASCVALCIVVSQLR